MSIRNIWKLLFSWNNLALFCSIWLCNSLWSLFFLSLKQQWSTWHYLFCGGTNKQKQKGRVRSSPSLVLLCQVKGTEQHNRAVKALYPSGGRSLGAHTVEDHYKLECLSSEDSLGSSSIGGVLGHAHSILYCGDSGQPREAAISLARPQVGLSYTGGIGHTQRSPKLGRAQCSLKPSQTDTASWAPS